MVMELQTEQLAPNRVDMCGNPPPLCAFAPLRENTYKLDSIHMNRE